MSESSTNATGHTRAQMADAIDEAHNALRVAENALKSPERAGGIEWAREEIGKALAALRGVGAGTEAPTNRFRQIIPNAIPWRERSHGDALVAALVAMEATNAEAIDVLAADREEMRKQNARLLMWQPLPMIAIDNASPGDFGPVVYHDEFRAVRERAEKAEADRDEARDEVRDALAALGHPGTVRIGNAIRERANVDATQRDALLRAILDAAIAAGICRSDVEALDGPSAIMLCGDLATMSKIAKAERALRKAKPWTLEDGCDRGAVDAGAKRVRDAEDALRALGVEP